mgnify:CR=1 FL=1
MQLLIVGADQIIFNTLIYHLILQSSVIKLSTLTVKLDLYHVLLTTQKYTDLLTLNVLHMMLQLNRLRNNVLIGLRPAKNTILEIIVFHLNQRTLSNKSLTMAHLLLLFQFTEISLFTKVDYIKSILKIKNSLQNMLSKLLDGM